MAIIREILAQQPKPERKIKLGVAQVKSLFFICLPHSNSETEGGTEYNSSRNQHKKRQHSY